MNDALMQLCTRHAAFWNGEGEAPLRQVTAHTPLRSLSAMPLADGSQLAEGQVLLPGLIDPVRFYNTHVKPKELINGDFITSVGPPHLCWTEAIMGCPIHVATGGPWAKPFIDDVQDVNRVTGDVAWLEKLDAFVDFLSARVDGQCPIVQPLMRGPLDMMASALGHEAMCLALITEPKASEAFLDRCADLFIEIANRRLAHTPVFQGGYLSSYGIWAPGPVVRTQVDNGTMLSPKVYRERARSADQKVIEAFDYSLIHMHSGCLHLSDVLLEIDALKVIQVSIDYPGGPLAAEVMPIIERIMQKKPVIVTGPVSEAELGMLEALKPAGRMCFQVQLV
jgi:hypothetical protein